MPADGDRSVGAGRDAAEVGEEDGWRPEGLPHLRADRVHEGRGEGRCRGEEERGGGGRRQGGTADEERRDGAVREDVRSPAAPARLLCLPHRLFPLTAEAGRERPDGEEDPEERVGPPASEAEDESPDEAAGKRTGRADDAQERRGTRDEDVDGEAKGNLAKRGGSQERGRVRERRKEGRQDSRRHERRDEVVVQLGGEALDGGSGEAGEEERHALGRRRAPSRDERGERQGAEAAEEDVAGKAAPALPLFHGRRGPAERDAAEGREAVAEGEEAPPRRREGEAVRKEEDEDEDDERVEQDADRVAARAVVRAEEGLSAEAREHEEIEREGPEGAEGSAPPVEPPEEEREDGHPDVDGLPFRLGGVEAQLAAASAACSCEPTCSSSASVKGRGAAPVSRS